jgi:hypothetical protein
MRFRLFGATSEFLRKASESRPILLILPQRGDESLPPSRAGGATRAAEEEQEDASG